MSVINATVKPDGSGTYNSIGNAIGAATNSNNTYIFTIYPNTNNAVWNEIIYISNALSNMNITFIGTDRTNVKINQGVWINCNTWTQANDYYVSLQNMTILGNRPQGSGKNTVIDIRIMKSYKLHLNIDSCTISAENVTGKGILWGPENTGSFAEFIINNCEIKDSKDSWTCIDNAPNYGVPGSQSDNIRFTNNTVKDVDGSCAFRGPSTATSNTSCLIHNNLFDYNYNAHPSFWAAFELNNCKSVTITNNEVAEIPYREQGNGHAFQIWNRLENWSLVMKNNNIHDNSAGPYIAVDSIANNQIASFSPTHSNTTYAGPFNNSSGNFLNGASVATGASIVNMGSNAVTFYTPSGYIQYNKFVNNTHFGCCMSAYPPIDGNGNFAGSGVNGFNAKYNWWNNSTGPSGASQGNPEGLGEGDSANKMLDFKPWAGDYSFNYFVNSLFKTQTGVSGLMNDLLNRSYIGVQTQKIFKDNGDYLRKLKMRNSIKKI
jgi:hypothetical protein